MGKPKRIDAEQAKQIASYLMVAAQRFINVNGYLASRYQGDETIRKNNEHIKKCEEWAKLFDEDTYNQKKLLQRLATSYR